MTGIEALRIVAVTLLSVLVLGILTWVTGKVLKFERRLIVSPLITLGFSPFFGLRGTALQAVVAQFGSPTIVMTFLLATEYDAEPAFVTAAIFTSTLFSSLTMTPLLTWLGA